MSKLNLSQWLKIADAAQYPLCLVRDVVNGDRGLIEQIPSILSDSSYRGSHPQILVYLWTLLSSQDRALLASPVVSAIFHRGGARDFEQVEDLLRNAGPSLSSEDFAGLLSVTAFYLVVRFHRRQLSDEYVLVAPESRVFRLLKIISEHVEKPELSSLFSESLPDSSELEATRLVIWHYVVSVIDPKGFCEIVANELKYLDSFLPFGQESKDYELLQRALKAYCPPILFFHRMLEGMGPVCESLGAVFLSFDLWLLSRMANSSILPGLPSELLPLLTDAADCDEPIVSAIAVSLCAMISPERFTTSVMSLPLAEGEITVSKLASAALSLALAGSVGVKELQRVISTLPLNSFTSEVIFDVLGIVPGWRDPEILSCFNRLGFSETFPRNLSSRCAWIPAQVNFSSPREVATSIFSLFQEMELANAPSNDYAKALASVFFEEQDLAIGILVNHLLKGGRDVWSVLRVLKLLREQLPTVLSSVNLRALHSALQTAMFALTDSRLRLEILEIFVSLGTRADLEASTLLEIFRRDEDTDFRVAAARYLGRCSNPLGVGYSYLDEVESIFSKSSPIVRDELAQTFLPLLDRIRRYNGELANSIVKSAIACAFSDRASEEQSMEIIKQVLGHMEPRIVDPSCVYREFLLLFSENC